MNLGAGFMPFDVTAGLCFFFFLLTAVNSTDLEAVGILKGGDTTATLYNPQFCLINLIAISIVCSSNVHVDCKTAWMLFEVYN